MWPSSSTRTFLTEIDHLYDVMQKELDAKPEAQHLMKVMGEFINHARRQNDELTKELKRLNLVTLSVIIMKLRLPAGLMNGSRRIDKDLTKCDAQAIKDDQALYTFGIVVKIMWEKLNHNIDKMLMLTKNLLLAVEKQHQKLLNNDKIGFDEIIKEQKVKLLGNF